MLGILGLSVARVRAKGEYGLIVVGILLNVQPELTSGVEIEYYDCTQPFEVHTYDRKSLCTIPDSGLDQQRAQTYQILKERKTGMMELQSCTVERSVLQGLCSVWDHLLN